DGTSIQTMLSMTADPLVVRSLSQETHLAGAAGCRLVFTGDHRRPSFLVDCGPSSVTGLKRAPLSVSASTSPFSCLMHTFPQETARPRSWDRLPSRNAFWMDSSSCSRHCPKLAGASSFTSTSSPIARQGARRLDRDPSYPSGAAAYALRVEY